MGEVDRALRGRVRGRSFYVEIIAVNPSTIFFLKNCTAHILYLAQGNIHLPTFTIKKSKETTTIALQLSDCIAKTYISQENEKCKGRNVLSHCNIVGEVARELINRMPDWLRVKLFPAGSELVAGAHDTGKISPTFQEKIYRGTERYEYNSKSELEHADPHIETELGGHAGVSQAATEKMAVGKYIPEILGQHHGYSPPLGYRKADDECFGGKTWQARREEFIETLKQALNCDWPTITSSLQARVLAGLTTVSDWIGSSSPFENPDYDWHTLIPKALDDAGFVQPKLLSGLTFSGIFGFSPRELQQKLIEHANQPGVYILEAPMGYGKTEAALYAAYLAMDTGKATGIYFALPTQLTSDKIHDRVNQFLQKILSSDCRHRRALLLHGNAWLTETEMGEEGKPGGSWFQSGKRGILAPFAVGTIDQALMAVMNVKHGFVRTFGLAGKVVILDEVHSYDTYTGTILNKLVEALRSIECTVIILSATLTQERRYDLLGTKPTNENYPLISSLPNNQTLQEVEVEPLVNSEIAINFIHDDNRAIDEALERAEQGQHILWIENTVDNAQKQFRLLAAKAAGSNIECGLLHSRFLKNDRAKNEDNWVRLYGKENPIERQLKGRILIGTQVLEQSLDIDADFLITRICPTDMLLQRLGRLWRHQTTVRPASARQEVYILAPHLTDAIENPEKAFDNTARVYSPYILCRSLAVWKDLKKVILPMQIRQLIEETYVEQIDLEPLCRYKADLIKVKNKLAGLALVGLSQGGKTLPENKASTRYSEQDTVEVLLIKAFQHRDDKSGTDITFLNGEQIFLLSNCKAQKKQVWFENAVKLMQNTICVAEHLAPAPIAIKNLGWLSGYIYLGDPLKEEALLRVALVRENGEVVGLHSGVTVTKYAICYDDRLGHQTKKQ